MNKNLLIKIAGLVLSGAGALLGAYAGKQENKEALAKLVEEHFKKQA